MLCSRSLAAWLFFFEQLGALLRKERIGLSYTPTAKETAAGIDRFKKFGSWPTILRLAKAFNCTPKEVLLLGYEEVFATLYLWAEERRYQEEYKLLNTPPK